MSDNEYWDEATEHAYWDYCAQIEAEIREKDDELIPRGEARNLAYEIFNHFMQTDFLLITPADIDEKVDAISAVPHEMSAVEYIREYRRMCDFYFGKPATDGGVDGCGDCPGRLNGKKNCIFSPTRDESSIPIIEKFAREHPEEAELRG